MVPTWPCCHIIDEKLLVEQVIVLTLSLAHQGVENHKKSCKSKGIFDTFKRDHDSIKQFNKIYDNGYRVDYGLLAWEALLSFFVTAFKKYANINVLFGPQEIDLLGGPTIFLEKMAQQK